LASLQGVTLIGGRYTLLERVGSGAMGVVWRARDEVLAREVAVKQLITGDHQRAMREARNAARLHHPHAIAVFDVVGSDDEEPWIVMEYLPSQSLSAVIAEAGPLAPAQAARIGGFIASALASAHSVGLVHRDIKPGNVLIGHDGTVKITDFGISKSTGDGTMTETGMISGTPAYLAPEVARGEQPDAASDVFSLGATIYSAIEGESVFGPSDNSFGLIYRAASGQLRDPKNAGELTPLLKRLLAVDPKKRPTAQAAVELLVAEQQPSQPLTILTPPKKRRKLTLPKFGLKRPKLPKRRTLVVLVVVALLAYGGISGAVYWNDYNNASSGSTNLAEFPQSGAGERFYSPSEANTLVKDFYALLPDQPAAAWQHLSERTRESLPEFEKRWKMYEWVRCDAPGTVRGHGPNWVVTVGLVFKTSTGQEGGQYDVELERTNNLLKIISFTKMS